MLLTPMTCAGIVLSITIQIRHSKNASNVDKTYDMYWDNTQHNNANATLSITALMLTAVCAECQE
jgi:hypothetical protein